MRGRGEDVDVLTGYRLFALYLVNPWTKRDSEEARIGGGNRGGSAEDLGTGSDADGPDRGWAAAFTGWIGVREPAPQQADEADVVEKPFLDISIRDLTEQDKERRGIDVGVLVTNVLDDGPSVGILQRDDVVLAINGVNVESGKELIGAGAD